MDNRTTAETSIDPEAEGRPTADDISVVFHEDPPPVVVRRRRPPVLTVLWLAALVAGAVTATYFVREALDTSPPANRSIEVGAFRSLTDDGVLVDLQCDRRRPTRFGSPCLGDTEFIDALLAGRPSVLLVGNVTSARRPDGVIQCVEILAGEGDVPPVVASVRCPDHGFVAAG